MSGLGGSCNPRRSFVHNTHMTEGTPEKSRRMGRIFRSLCVYQVKDGELSFTWACIDRAYLMTASGMRLQTAWPRPLDWPLDPKRRDQRPASLLASRRTGDKGGDDAPARVPIVPQKPEGLKRPRRCVGERLPRFSQFPVRRRASGYFAGAGLRRGPLSRKALLNGRALRARPCEASGTQKRMGSFAKARPASNFRPVPRSECLTSDLERVILCLHLM